MKTVVDFTALQIKLASPDDVREWSYGEVLKPETINYRTLKPENDGLFAENIFGPAQDFKCSCGKYSRIRYRGIVCDKCGVEVTLSRVRRERMGHITLSAPVAHIWYFKGAPSRLSLLLDISPRNLSTVIYFSQHIVLEVDKEKRVVVLERLETAQATAIEELRTRTKERIETAKEELIQQLKDIDSRFKDKETIALKKEAVELKVKQLIANLQDELEIEIGKTTELYQTLRDMVKKIHYSSIISEDEYLKLLEYNAIDHIRVGMGAESILEIVRLIDLSKLSEKLREEIESSSGQKRIKATRRLRVVEGFRKSGVKPEFMFFLLLPVIPPDLRPMVQLSGGRFATSDLNDLYRRVINRNNRLKHLMDLGAPEIILRNEKRMLQEAVDALIDGSNARVNQSRVARRPLRSLSEMLRGKQGRFRQNLLGKRVDYSGRSVIFLNDELPKSMTPLRASPRITLCF